MKLLLTLTILVASMFVASAQTPNTNDVRVTWNVPMMLSTNQFNTYLYFYKQGTNGIPNPPIMVDHFRDSARELVNVELNRLAEVRRQEEAAKASFATLREWWLEATEAQRQALLLSLP